MSPRAGEGRAWFALFLILVVASLLSGCGRKAKPEPLWGRSVVPQAVLHTR